MNPTDLQIIETMEQRGGSFVRALAECFRRADRSNTIKLLNTFRDYWEAYRDLTIKEMEVAALESAS